MKYLFYGEEEANDYNTKLYIKSDWNPPLANNLIETSIDHFEEKLTSICSDIKLNCKPSTNISPTQEKLLHSTRNNKNIVILQTYKNLGATTMEWEEYVKSMLDKHLLKGETYELLSTEDAIDKKEEFRDELIDLLTFEGDRVLEDNEIVYFSRGLKSEDRIPQ